MNEQTNTNDTNESSNSSMLSRSAQMLQAASPYLDESTKNALESIVHVTDFLETIQAFRQKGFSSMFSGLLGGRSKNSDTVSMANLNSRAAALDTESILRSIRPFCTQNEGSLIDRIMNMLNMQKFFKMYQTMQSMMSMMNMTNNNSNQNTEPEPSKQETSQDYQDTNPYYDTYWNSFNNNDVDNVNAYDDIGTSQNSEYSYYTDDNTQSNNEGNHINFNQDLNQDYNADYNEGFNQSFNATLNPDANSYIYNQNMNNFNYNPNGNNYDFNQDFNQDFSNSSILNGINNNSTNTNSNTTNTSNNSNTTSDNSNSTTNTQMLDMLSTLIPPEQKSTFDAMKLLIESGMLK